MEITKKSGTFAQNKSFMSENVNIQLDSKFINELTAIALAKGRTLSEEIEYRLRLIPLDLNIPEQETVSSKLRGIIKLPKTFDYKKEISRWHN